MKNEKELCQWAQNIKNERGLTWKQIADKIKDKTGIEYYESQLSQSLNWSYPRMNGTKIAMTVIEIYEGVKFEKDDGKPVRYFNYDTAA